MGANPVIRKTAPYFMPVIFQSSKAGANPNDRPAGYTALHSAVLRGDQEMVAGIGQVGGHRGRVDGIVEQVRRADDPLVVAGSELLDLHGQPGSRTEPSSAIVQPGLCATSQG